MNPISVLFVDDEANVLAGLRRMLRAYRDQWTIDFVLGGRAALEKMEHATYDAIISDMKMPEVDGVQVLKGAKEYIPSAIRCVLSGQADRDQTHRVLSYAHQFISKPCDLETLEGVIKKAQILKAKLPGVELKNLVSQIVDLPSTPENYDALMETLGNREASIDRVASIIERDLAMSAKVIQLVSSSFFTQPHLGVCPRAASKLLGLDILRELAFKSKVFRPFQVDSIPGFSIQELTEHSIEVAQCARGIAIDETGDRELGEQAYLAGLFHDLGKVVLADQLADQYRTAVELANQGSITLWATELQTFGTTHTEIGSYLLALWGISPEVVDAVACHHDPSDCHLVSFGPTTAVHVANILKRRHHSSQREERDLLNRSKHLVEAGLVDRIPNWCSSMQAHHSSSFAGVTS